MNLYNENFNLLQIGLEQFIKKKDSTKISLNH